MLEQIKRDEELVKRMIEEEMSLQEQEMINEAIK
jgi:hypothetical protein